MRNWKDLRDIFWCFLRKYSWTWNRGIIYLFTLLNKHYHFKSWTGGVWPSTGSKAAPVPEHKSSLLTKRISEVAQMLQCPPLKFTAWFLSIFVRFTKYNNLLPSGKTLWVEMPQCMHTGQLLGGGEVSVEAWRWLCLFFFLKIFWACTASSYSYRLSFISCLTF